MICTDWSLLQLQLWFFAPNSDQPTALLKIVCFPACLIVIYYIIFTLIDINYCLFPSLSHCPPDEIFVGEKSKGARIMKCCLLN